MAIQVEVKTPSGRPKTYPFEVVPRIGEKIALRDDDEWQRWKITDLIHYQGKDDFQVGIVVVPTA